MHFGKKNYMRFAYIKTNNKRKRKIKIAISRSIHLYVYLGPKICIYYSVKYNKEISRQVVET